MQALTEWPGDVGSLLTEMKRRAGVNTDTELARLLETSQSNVSTWRKRGGVPNAILLKFERVSFDAEQDHASRLWAARTIAIRVAEFAHERAGSRKGASRWVFYSTIASAWNILTKAIMADLQKREALSHRGPSDLASELIDDGEYLGSIADWVLSLSAAELLADAFSGLPQWSD